MFLVFLKAFLFTDINMDIILEIFFLFFSKVDITFIGGKLI